jgi:hypothetical protein
MSGNTFFPKAWKIPKAEAPELTEQEAIQVTAFGLDGEYTPLQRFEDRCAVTRLVRNHDSVHVRGCRMTEAVKDPITPWLWAEGKSREEIASAFQNGLRFCRVCHPLALFPRESERAVQS